MYITIWSSFITSVNYGHINYDSSSFITTLRALFELLLRTLSDNKKQIKTFFNPITENVFSYQRNEGSHNGGRLDGIKGKGRWFVKRTKVTQHNGQSVKDCRS